MNINLGPLGLRIGRLPQLQRKATFGDIQAARALKSLFGEGAEWAKPAYGDYYSTSVPAYRAIKLRADAISSAPIVVFGRNQDGTPQAVEENHPIQMLMDKVNPWWTSGDLWKATETYLCLWGSAFWFLERSGSQVTAIWPLRPDKMRIIADRRKAPNTYILGYVYEDVKRLSLLPEEIVWFRYFNPSDEYGGLSPIAPARLTLDMGKDALKFNRRFFENGAMPQDLIFTVQGPVTEEEVEDFYLRLGKRHTGATKAHRPMVWDLSQGGKPERLGLTQRDMEFMAALNFTVEDAARVWGVPPPKMYSQQQAIYNNVKQADIEFFTDTVSAEWRFLEMEVNELLIPLLGAEELFMAFDTSHILPLQEAMAEQHAREREDVKSGILTINEVRQGRNLEPVAWGDRWWVSITVAPAGEGEEVAAALPGRFAPRMPKGFGEGVEERALVLHDKRLSAGGQKFLQLQRSLFNAQRVDVQRRLRAKKEWTKNQGDELFPLDIWRNTFVARGLPIIRTILTLSAQGEASDVGLGAFDPRKQAIQEWVKERAEFWAERVNLDTAQLLMEEVTDGISLGESIPQLSERVEKVFRFSHSVRAERIARTETLAATSKGHLAVWEQSGVVEEKMWLTAQDERVREAHAEAHRQVVPFNSPFIVGGEELEAPGIGGSPGNVINCRCRAVPILSGIRQLNRQLLDGHGANLATK